MEKYNGWSNYATWRVNLEIFDGMSPDDVGYVAGDDDNRLPEVLKDWAFEIINQAPDGFVKDYAFAFLANVNWYEIARMMVEAYAEEDAE